MHWQKIAEPIVAIWEAFEESDGDQW